MPSGYQFTFRVNDENRFRCNIQSEQCSVMKASGQRCRRRVCIGSPYCFSHLLYIKHLRIKTSTIPNAGKGLFAVDPMTAEHIIVFRAGDTIIEYTGEVISDAQKQQRNGNHTAVYTVQTKKNQHIDCACRRGVGSTANTSPGNNNATLSVNNRNSEVKVKATKNIRNGDEIFISYGNTYRLNQPTSHTTKYHRRLPEI